ncbi:MAG: hypothetical protein WAW96_21935 [Alphaproteobacteria bacterium]
MGEPQHIEHAVRASRKLELKMRAEYHGDFWSAAQERDRSSNDHWMDATSYEALCKFCDEEASNNSKQRRCDNADDDNPRHLAPPLAPTTLHVRRP